MLPWIRAPRNNNDRRVRNVCFEYNYADDLCVRQTPPTYTHTRGGGAQTNTSPCPWYNTSGRCGLAHTITLWHFIHESSRSLATPVRAWKQRSITFLPGARGRRGLYEQMDGPIPEGSGSPDGFLYEGLEYRSVTHFRALSFMMSSCFFFSCSKLRHPLRHRGGFCCQGDESEMRKKNNFFFLTRQKKWNTLIWIESFWRRKRATSASFRFSCIFFLL